MTLVWRPGYDDGLTYTPGKVALKKEFTQQGYMWEFPAQYGLWSPANITTSLWLDAADPNTVTTVGGAVSQWNDKSGNSRHASQGTASNRPVYQSAAQNGLNVVRFTAASQHSMAAGAAGTWNFLHNGTASSVFIVARVRDTGDNPLVQHALIDTGGASQFNIGFLLFYDDTTGLGNNTIRVLVSSGSQYPVIATSVDQITPGTYNILGTYIDADNPTSSDRLVHRINGNAELKSNNQTAGVSVSNSTFALNLGRVVHDNSLHLTGDICEVLILSNQPSTSDRQRIEGYLAHKWGLTANLPGDHPYKTVGPTL
jgi:hypothetical protein